MANIIEGTTPSIGYRFTKVDVSDFVAAVLSIKNGENTIEKELDAAIVDAENNIITWTLTQAETLAFGNNIQVQMNFLLNGGIRGATKETTYWIADNLKKEIIDV